jgi:exonuclease 1
MGVRGLHKFLEEHAIVREMSYYAGKRIGVDTFIWIYRGGLYGRADELQGGDNLRAIPYVLKMARQLVSCGIYPVFVFDSRAPPAKSDVISRRLAIRLAAKEEALLLHDSGPLSHDDEAKYRKLCQKAFVPTPDLISRTINTLRLAGYTVVVAPYEADSQLAYMSQAGYIYATISEDSDPLVFGCNRLLTKLNFVTMQAIELDINSILSSTKFHSWDFDMFVDLCVLSGSDYGQSIRGIGVKKAYKMLCDRRNGLEVIWHYSAEKGSDFVLYAREFSFAKAVFCKSWVFTSNGECRRIDGTIGQEGLNIATGPPICEDICSDVMHGIWDKANNRSHLDVPFLHEENKSIRSLIRNKFYLQVSLNSILTSSQ